MYKQRLLNYRHQQKKRTLLLIYCTIISLVLSISSLSGFTFANIVAFVLTLPIFGYVATVTTKQIITNRLFAQKYGAEISLFTKGYDLPYRHFSLQQFLFQPNFSFRFSLILLFLALFTIVSKNHAAATTAISYVR